MALVVHVCCVPSVHIAVALERGCVVDPWPLCFPRSEYKLVSIEQSGLDQKSCCLVYAELITVAPASK